MTPSRKWTAILLVVLCLAGFLAWKEWSLNDAQRDFMMLLDQQTGNYNEDRVVLSSTTRREAERMAEEFGGMLRITKDGSFAVINLPEGMTLSDIAQNNNYRKYHDRILLDYNNFSTADEDVADDTEIRSGYVVEDPMYAQQTYIDYLNIGGAWDLTRGADSNGEKVVVAIIDTGIDTDHPEFYDADGNIIISTQSYDATNDKAVDQYDISVIEDADGHGTAVAGIIAAQMNAEGVAGIAPDVELLVIKCETDEVGEFKSSADIVFAIYYAIEMDVDVINMSLGGSSGEDMAKALQLAVDSNIICVAAAGNESTDLPYFPAAYDTVIGVGALAADNWMIADYSNYGINSDLVAPGTALTSTVGGNYTYQNGTSMSAPMVTAAVALYKAQNQYVTYDQLKAELLAAGKDLGDLGEDHLYGFGALDINAFICEEKGIITYDYCTEEIGSTTQVFVRRHTIQTVPEPERENVVFDDWYYDKAYTRVFDYDAWYSTEFVEDVTLYAKWVNEEDEGASVYNYRTLPDGTIEIVNYKGKRRYLTIPDEIDGKVVTSIGRNAFANNTRLREVTFPEGLVYIRESAFSRVSKMRKITFTGNNLLQIDRNAFVSCTSLRKLDLPDSVTTIGAYAFSACSTMNTVGISENSSLKTIGDFAFSGTSVSSFYIPVNVNAGGFNGSVLSGCTAMCAVSVHPRNTAFSVSGSTLYNAEKTEIVYYPAALTGSYAVADGVNSIGKYAFHSSSVLEMNLNSVTTIGQHAFAATRKLNSVVLPDSVTVLKESAFQQSSITQVTLSANLNKISKKAFSYAKLIGVHIPAGVQDIGPNAFASCRYLQSLTFAEDSQLQSIGDYAFEDCSLLKNFDLPDSLTSIGKCAFYCCGSITRLTIPANVTVIGGSAFRYCYLLEQVDFADRCKLESVPDACFANCSVLHTVNFSDGIVKLGNDAFRENRLLHNLNFGENSSLTTVGEYCFYSCSTLQDMQMPDSVSSIGQFAYAFSGLTSVEINVGMTSVGHGAFGACYLLTEIRVDEANTAYTAEDNVLFDKNQTTVHCVPASRAGSYTLPETVKVTAPYSFYYDQLLTAVIMPQGLEDIQMNSFYNCRRLAGIEIPANVTNIGRKAFENCWSLTSVTFGAGSRLERLGIYTFVNCGMSEIIIPASVQEIAQYAFYNCYSLRKITFEENSALTYIASYLFKGTRVESVIFEEGSALTSIQAHAFDGSDWLKTVDFGDAKIASVDNYAFYNCVNLAGITLPETVTYVGRYAFYGCSVMDRIDMPETVDYIGESAFLGTNSLRVFFAADHLPANAQNGWDNGIAGYFLDAVDYVVTDEWEYAIRGDGTIALAVYKGNSTELIIDAVDGYTVSRIGARCFRDKDFLKGITLSENITEIGNYAFCDCDGLTAVTVPASVKRIGKYAFADTAVCVTIVAGSNLEVIDDYAFSGNATASVVLPDSVKTIGDGAFLNSSLSSLRISQTSVLEIIGRQAFVGSSVTEIFLPASLKTLGEEAFKDVTSLNCVEIAAGDTALKLANGAFEGTGIREILIPARVWYIGEYTLGSCQDLLNIYVDSGNASYTSLDGVLCDINGTTLIQYPSGRSGAYEVPAQITVLTYSSFRDAKDLAEVTFAEGSTVRTIGWQTFSGCESLTKITVPDTVVSFDSYAFENCTALTDLVLGEGTQLSGVYEGAFYNCTALANVTLPDTVMEISDYAFYNCVSLTSFPLSENSQVKGIYDYAFYGCTGITEASAMPELVEIGEFAFAHTAITEYTVGAAVRNIAPNAFTCCENLSVISCDEANEEYKAIDGVLYDKDATGAEDFAALVMWPYNKVALIGEGKTAITGLDAEHPIFYIASKVRIADTVTRIGDGTFRNHTALYSVIIPESVKSIGANAFHNCKMLSDVVLPDSVCSIEEGAFRGCVSLSVITIPKNATVLADETFDNCTGLTNVELPDTLTSIGSGCFRNCTALESIIIPDEVAAVGEGAFSGCGLLKSITIPENVTMLSDAAFFNCVGLTDVALPDTLSSIGKDCFRQCSGLACIQIPDGVVTIGANAFRECTALKTAEIPGSVTEIGTAAFRDCTGLQSVYMHDGVTTIQYAAFTGCISLEKVVIPDSAVMESYDIFDRCPKLRTAGPLGGDFDFELGWSSSIPEFAFSGCESLTEVTIPEGVQSIEPDAFSGCVFLSYVYLPDSVTSIGADAFENCFELHSVGPVGSGCGIEYGWTEEIPAKVFEGYRFLTDVQIADTILKIGERAFYGCSGITSLTIPESVTVIGKEAFESCSRISEIRFNAVEMADLGVYSDVFYYAGNLSQGISVVIGANVTRIPAYLFNPHSSGCNIVSLEFEENSRCTSIGYSAFEYCDSLGVIYIPASVTQIGGYAFATGGNTVIALRGKTSLLDSAVSWTDGVVIENVKRWGGEKDGFSYFITNDDTISISAYTGSDTQVIMPEQIEGMPVTFLAARVFMDRNDLVSIDLPDELEKIGDYAFSGCSSLESLVLPETLTHIGSTAFSGCTGLKNLDFPVGLTHIGNSAFSGCTGLENLDFPVGLTRIGNSAFSGCSGLTALNLPETVEWIGSAAFADCAAVEILVIPSSVEFIGNGAFRSCTQLCEIYFNAVAMENLQDYNHLFDNAGINGEGIKVIVGSQVTQIPNYLFRPYGGHAIPNIVSLEFEEGSACQIIGKYAFDNCKYLKTIEIPANVTTIGERAFYQCTGVETLYYNANATNFSMPIWHHYAYLGTAGDGVKVTIGKNVTEIPGYFMGSSTPSDEPINVSEVVFEEGSICHTINNYAFGYCDSLQSVKLPESLVVIDEWAFCRMGLKSVTIPKNTIKISSAFYECKSLKVVQVDSPDIARSVPPELYKYADTVVFPADITEVDSKITSKFQHTEELRIGEALYISYSNHAHEWSLKETVAYIECEQDGVEAYCCSSCGMEKRDVVSAHTFVEHIVKEATCMEDGSGYKVCSKCEHTVTYVIRAEGDHSFERWVTVEEATDSSEGQSRRDCRNCDHFETGNFTTVASGACGFATEWVVKGDGELWIYGKGDTFLWSAYQHAPWAGRKIYSVYIDDSVTSVGAWAFSGAVKLKTVRFSEKMTVISAGMFSGCTGLPEIILPEQIVTIDAQAFENCTGLTSITIPENVTYLGGRAFSGCTSLEEIRLEAAALENIAQVDNRVFYRAGEKGRGITLTVGAKVTRIPNNLFTPTYNNGGSAILTRIVFEPGSVCESIGSRAFYGCTSLQGVTIPESVKTLGSYAFYGCTGLTSFTIPASLESFDQSVVQGCSGILKFEVDDANQNYSASDGILFNKDGTTLVRYPAGRSGTYTIPEYVSEIASGAFSGCSGLTSVQIPDSVTSIGSYIFDGCASLTSIEIPSNVTTLCDNVFNGWTGLTEITIPKSVTSIGMHAFEECENLVKIAIPDGITKISSYMFRDCSSLTEVLIPESVTSIGSYIFDGCASLTSIEIPLNVTALCDNVFDGWTGLTEITIPESVTSIGMYAFNGCENLVKIAIPDGITEISSSTFRNCSSLTEVLIPESVTSIDSNIFEGCASLKSVDLPNSITYFADSAFYRWKGLTEIILPEGLETIESNMFSGCINLTKVTIPSSVRSINRAAFFGCSSLASITIPEKVSFIDPSAFSGCASLCSITIPKNVSSIYENAFKDCSSLSVITFCGKAPYISSSAFTNVEAHVSYQSEDTTWTESKMQNYGGTLTWHAACSAHEWGEWFVENEPSCAKYGTERRNCVNCECFEIRATTRTDHNYEHVVTKPSCTASGYTTHTCTSCGKRSVDTYVDSLGHTPGETVVENKHDALCEIDGYHDNVIYCSVCQTEVSRVRVTDPAKGHSYESVVTEPTCTEEGFTVYTCSVCGDSYVADYIDPVDHVYEGGACKWCGDEEEVEKVYTITWKEAYSSLGGNIAVVFKAELSKDLAEDPNAFMRFTYAGKTVDVPVSEAGRSGSYYNFFCRITSVNMTDDITAQMMVGEEAIGRSVTTSLEKYCSYIAGSSKDEKTVNLMKAMLNYGAAAQKMMNYKLDNLANKSLSASDKVLTKVDATRFKHSISGTEDGIKPVEALLVLGSETTIRVGFQLTGNKSIEEYTFTVDGAEVEPVYKGGKYVLEVPNIAAHLLDEYHTFTCGGITITYCGLSYVNQVMSYYTEGTTFDMAAALYNYSQATEAYIN